MKFSLVLSFLLSLLPAQLLASSPDAWQEFRLDVEKTCRSTAEPLLTNARAKADPYGSQQHGIAIVFGEEKASSNNVIYVCLYDKKTKQAELYVGLTEKEM